MRKIILALIALLTLTAAKAQITMPDYPYTPHKLYGAYIYIQGVDTLGLFPSDTNYIWSSTGLTRQDTILFADGTKLYTAGGSSNWTESGTNLYPNDTTLNVAVGTTDAGDVNLFVDGFFRSEKSPYNLVNDSISALGNTFPFAGAYYNLNDTNYYLNGISDILGGNLYTVMGQVSEATDFDMVYANKEFVNIYSVSSSYSDSAFAGMHAMRYKGGTVGTETDIHFNTLDGITLSYKLFDGGTIVRGRRLFIDSLGINLQIKNIGEAIYTTALGIDSLKQITFNEAYTFPTLDGNSGDVLTTDGSGMVSWQPASGGASYWDSTSTVIHLNDSTAKVAIGTSKLAGTEKLRVLNGSVLFDGATGAYPLPAAGTSGTVLMWYPAKAALWAGRGFAGNAENIYIGDYSTCFGVGNRATGIGSHASGELSYCSNYYGFAHGYGNAVTGHTSVGIGTYVTTSGDRSAGFNIYTTSDSYAMTSFGQYNTTGGMTAGSWVSTDKLFVIGNGTGTGANANDAFRVLKNGTTYIGDASSSTDPIMTVSTTDSVTTLIGCMKLVPQADPPASPAQGMIYADTDHHLYYYDGSTWKQLD